MELSPINTPNTSEAFWQLVESEHGQVLAFSLTRLISVQQDDPKFSIDNVQKYINTKKRTMHWGICYVTQAGLYFNHFSHNSFLSSMLNQKANNEFCLHFPFEKITQWKKSNTEQKGFFSSQKELFLCMQGMAIPSPLTPQQQNIEVKNITINQATTYVMTFEFKGKDIITLLQTKLPGLEL